MGYLICKKCGGYYELQPGENPEDFDKCDCGGKLEYSESSNYISHNSRKVPYMSGREEYWKKSWLRKYNLVLFIIVFAFIISGTIILQLIRPNPFNINLQLIFIVLLVIGLLFLQYRSSSKIEKRNIYIEYDKTMQEEDEQLEYDEYDLQKPLNLKSWLLNGVLPLLLIIILISIFILPLNGMLGAVLIVLASLAIQKYLANQRRNKP